MMAGEGSTKIVNLMIIGAWLFSRGWGAGGGFKICIFLMTCINKQQITCYCNKDL